MIGKKLISVVAGILTAYKLRGVFDRRATVVRPVDTSPPQLSQADHSDGRAMPESSDEHAQRRDEVEKYVAADVSSINRVRGVVLVLITASVFSFTTYWQSGGTQLDRRIVLRQDALAFIDWLRSAQEPNEPRQLKRGEAYLRSRGLDPRNPEHKSLLVDEVRGYERLRMERDVVRVPFFGVEVETNDVMLFSGFTLLVGLLWLRLSLMRELRNLKLVFKRAREAKKVRLCYELLAMQQVLSNPPVYGQEDPKAWNLIPKLLFLVPLISYSPLLWSNYASAFRFMLFDISSAPDMVFSTAFLVSICVLTLQCIKDSLKIDKVWKEASLVVA
jgi:hypothetical protein